jgi:microcystin degradation protein MlrC
MNMRIFLAGYQHETNTFAPSLADWAAFTRGEAFPAFMRGASVIDTFRGVNAPVGGFVEAAAANGWTLVPSAWAGATPSSYVTEDAFERIAAAMVEDLRAACSDPRGLDAIYLDLHGAAVAQHADDSEGELLARLRAVVGPRLPIVASLDLHANVTRRMLELADALVSYRTYPHVDMAATGALAARLLERRVARGTREPMHASRLPFLIPLTSQSTWMQPAKAHYERLVDIDRRLGTMTSFCMGFPAADFDECGPVVWSHGERAKEAVDAIFAAVAEPADQWALHVLDARDAVARALAITEDAENADKPVVIADTQDNPGAGGDSNTTGMLHALLTQGAGRRWPGRVALGMLFDEKAARRAHEVGVGGSFDGTLGTAVPTFTGHASDAPVAGRFTVRALSDGVCTLKGPMMTGLKTGFGASACLEVDGVLVAVVSGKAQLLDREMLRMVGITPERQRIIVVKSSNHFRADFTPIACEVIVAKAAGPMAVDPGDLPWKRLRVRARV